MSRCRAISIFNVSAPSASICDAPTRRQLTDGFFDAITLCVRRHATRGPDRTETLARLFLPFHLPPLNHLIAVAGGGFEFRSVQDVYAAARVLDHSCFLKSACRYRHARPASAEHV